MRKSLEVQRDTNKLKSKKGKLISKSLQQNENRRIISVCYFIFISAAIKNFGKCNQYHR